MRLRQNKGRGFYGVIAIATLGGVVLCFTPTDPVRELFWSAIVNGVIAVISRLAVREETMGVHVIGRRLRWRGWLATAAKAATVLAMLITLG